MTTVIHLVDTDEKVEEGETFTGFTNCKTPVGGLTPIEVNLSDGRLCGVCLNEHRADFKQWRHKKYTYALPIEVV